MANIESSFDYPGFDYAPQRTKIARKLALSQALQKQGMEPLDTNRMSGGWAIPISPFEGLAKMAQAYVGGKLGNDVSHDQADLAKTAQGNTRAALAQALGNSGLDQKEIDSYSAAMLDPMASQAMPFLAQGMQQKRQMALARQMFPGLFPDGQQAPAQSAGQTPVGQGTVLAPGAPSASRGGQAAGTSGLPAGSDMILGGGFIGMPALSKIGENQFELSKPQNMRPGSTYYDPQKGPVYTAPDLSQGAQITNGPNGPTASAIPGLSDVAANLAGNTERAKQLNQFHNVPQASGATIPMWGGNIPAGPGAAPPSPPGAPIRQQSPLQIPPASAPIVKAAPQAPAINPTPLGPQSPQSALKGPIKDPWQSMPRLQTPQGIGQGTYQKMTAENQAKQAGTMIEEHSKQAQDANSRMAINNQALELIDKADTGPGAAQMAGVKNILVSRFGIPEGDFENTPSATMVLNKDLMNTAIAKARQVFNNPRMTQMEVMQYLSKGAPNIDMPKAAMKFLLTADNAQGQYAIQQSGDLARFLNQGGDPTQFHSWYAKNFPMTNTLRDVQLPGRDTMAPPSAPLTATNPKTGAKIISHDGGKSWQAQ